MCAYKKSTTLFDTFIATLSECIKKDPSLIQSALRNVFSMRQFGNKTHGDLAEVAFTEFINKYIDGYKATHVGKEKFRSKKSEEDVSIETPSGETFAISLKAYGAGPLQLSTNKDSSMFKLLQKKFSSSTVADREQIRSVLDHHAFDDFHNVNVIPLIYDEKQMKFNITIFDVEKAYNSVQKVEYVSKGRGRKHPVYRFYGQDDQYIFEVRYGGTGANALQRGMWTHTKNATPFFKSLTGWMKYGINYTLLKMFAKALVSSESKHSEILDLL